MSTVNINSRSHNLMTENLLLRFSLLISFWFVLSIASWGQTGEVYAALASRALQNGAYENAELLMTQAIEKDSMNWKYFMLRGEIIGHPFNPNRGEKNGETTTQVYERALMDINWALGLEQGNASIFLARGRIHFSFNKYDLAFTDFQQASKFAKFIPDKIKAYCHMAEARFESDEIDASFQYLDAAYDLDTTYVLTLNTFAFQYMALGEYDDAIRYFNKVLAIKPENVMALSNLSFSAILAQKYDKALKIVNDAIILHPNSGILYNNRGFIRYQFAEYEAALLDINRSLELFPANAYAFKNRALVYLATEQKDLACSDLQRARSLGYTQAYDDEVINLQIEHCISVNRSPKGD